ncbi:MAG: zf-HC2 domain-containing protein [Acidobacteria bacterium]|nr:zf-HC2 domain-containing protein [Acidobacteriota bacterium]
MISLLTCKDFLRELNDFLDETCDPQMRQEIQRHISECPNCWVVMDTCKKTLKVYKGMEPQEVPADIQSRLMAALQKRIAAGGGKCSH